MLKLLLVILVFWGNIAFAQYEDFNNEVSVEEPSYALKFSLRILSPRIDFEKIINEQASVGFVAKTYLIWVPQGFRFEPYYRHYFKKEAPFGFYIQPKIGLGYFDFSSSINATRGMNIGGGLLVGGQFNIGKKKAVLDIFAGFQYMQPIYIQDGRYLSTSNSNFQISPEGFNLVHLLFMATPIELGLRIGFFKTKRKTVANLEQDFY